jgi:hypothetical protein
MSKHQDLWFEDGSIVLNAENCLFRVHISQLSRHSVCFRDMFAIPQPQLDDQLDCPLVHLHDSPDDVANLLFALYDGPYVYPLHLHFIFINLSL